MEPRDLAVSAGRQVRRSRDSFDMFDVRHAAAIGLPRMMLTCQRLRQLLRVRVAEDLHHLSAFL
nr:hypothetical protein [Rhodococcus sp. (in: high G+C Gram-positive bacteria)]